MLPQSVCVWVCEQLLNNSTIFNIFSNSPIVQNCRGPAPGGPGARGLWQTLIPTAKVQHGWSKEKYEPGMDRASKDQGKVSRGSNLRTLSHTPRTFV